MQTLSGYLLHLFHLNRFLQSDQPRRTVHDKKIDRPASARPIRLRLRTGSRWRPSCRRGGLLLRQLLLL